MAVAPLAQIRYLTKFVALVGVYFRECFAYPATAFIWILADTVVAVILPAVWLAATGPAETIAGFTRREIVTYYLVSIILAQFVTCHLMWNIASDIREGFFSAHIVRPFSYLAQATARNLAWRVSKLIIFVPIAFAFYFAFLGNSSPAPLHFSPSFFAAVLLGHVLSFLAAYCLSLITLWTVESFSIMEVYYVPEQILSGRLVPLAALPGWAMAASDVLYFRYTVAFPAEMLLRRLSASEIVRGLVLQALYIVFFYGLSKVMLRAGMKRYTGAGM
jgi:ABC-2 type transport system permease protein